MNGYLFNTSANWLLYNCVKREKRRFGKVLTVYFQGAVYDRFMNNKSVYNTSYRDLLNVINLYMWFPKGSKIWWKGTIVWFLGVFGFVPILMIKFALITVCTDVYFKALNWRFFFFRGDCTWMLKFILLLTLLST